MSIRQTHTFAELEVSQAAFDEIAGKLREAEYDHAFVDGAIDMHGIALVRGAPSAGAGRALGMSDEEAARLLYEHSENNESFDNPEWDAVGDDAREVFRKDARGFMRALRKVAFSPGPREIKNFRVEEVSLTPGGWGIGGTADAPTSVDGREPAGPVLHRSSLRMAEDERSALERRFAARPPACPASLGGRIVRASRGDRVVGVVLAAVMVLALVVGAVAIVSILW